MKKEDEALRQVAKENFEKISDSAVFMALFNEDMHKDPICLMQMGLAVYLNKPIALLVPEGSMLSGNLQRLAQRVEFYKPGDKESLFAATTRLALWINETKGQKDHEESVH